MKVIGKRWQCWDSYHFHESKCESLGYNSKSESIKTESHESDCESEYQGHESESLKSGLESSQR